MKASYFISVINSLCSAVLLKDTVKIGSLDDFDVESLVDSPEERALKKYLMTLTDTTLNTICALMDFGRDFAFKVLPINLTILFNKHYLPYWFDKNKDEKKEWTVNYLADKVSVLTKYLRRAEELLFYSKDKELKPKDDCGGALVEDEYDEQEYELHLKCLKCQRSVTKIVYRDYFRQQI